MLVLANIFQPIIDVFEQVLLFFHDNVGLGWGLSIILLTVTVRLVLFPLTYKQFKSMRALQTLAPEMKKLQEKYKDDRQRLNQEMMKFYQENKVNPFGSCLPLVFQMPVFVALFYMLRKDLKEDICGDAIARLKIPASEIVNTHCDTVAHGSAKFLFIPDLTAPATGGVLVLLLTLYVASQLLSSILMSTTVDKNQRYIMMALPFFFVLFVKGFPAGLLVYWITTNLWTVGQGYIMRRNAPPPPPAIQAQRDKDDARKAANEAKKSGGRGGTITGTPAPAGAVAGGSAAAPPPPPRAKKKKRSGRRR